MISNKKEKKIWHAWAFYDWANSVYPLVITSAIFPIFYGLLFRVKGITHIEIFGHSVKNTALISFTSALGFLIVSIISPLLSGIADYIGNKKIFMKSFSYLGALSCMLLYVFDLDHIYISLFIYLLALVGFWGSLVFYNSYLADIAPKSSQDSLSAKGYVLGYVGSVILLIFCLVLVMSPQSFGIRGIETEATKQAMRLSFVGVGLWWIGFSQYTYFYLPKGRKKEIHHSENKIVNGFRELKKVYGLLRAKQLLKRYLKSFFVYSMGVQTVMLVATYFGEQEIAWESASARNMGLIISILIIQLVAVLGAVLTSKVSKKIGNLKVLMLLNLVWISVCIYAFYIVSPMNFYIAAFVVGLVMGGTQALSRSTYSKLLDGIEDTTSFFSFYDVSEKVGIVFGIGIFGVIDQLTGSTRNSILLLGSFFLVGFILLWKVYIYGKKTNNYI